MLFLTEPRTSRRPPWPFRINWDSPQAEGLEVWVPFAFPAGVIFAKGGVKGLTSGTARFRAHAEGDYGIDFNTTDGNAATFAYPDAPFISSAGQTIIWRGMVDTISDYRHFASKHAAGGGTNNPFDFRTETGTQSIRCVRANAGGHQEMIGPNLTALKYHTIAVRHADNLIQTFPHFFLDGQKSTGTAGASSGTPTGAVTGSNEDIRIGNRTAGSAIQMDGFCAEARFHSKAISDGALEHIQRNPWDLYWRPTKAFFMVSAGGGGGASTGTRTFIVMP